MEERQARPEQGWRGGILSLLLHGLLLAVAALLVWRPPPGGSSVLPVDIIPLPAAKTDRDAGPEQKPAGTPSPRTNRTAAPRKEGVRPNATRQPEDELAARLRALAQLHQNSGPLPAIATGGSGNGAGAYTLRDFVRAQILRRWLPDLSLPGARGMSVTLRIHLQANGRISDVTVLDTARMQNDAAFHAMALSARDAAILSSPLHLPPGDYPSSQILTIKLNPEAVLK